MQCTIIQRACILSRIPPARGTYTKACARKTPGQQHYKRARLSGGLYQSHFLSDT